MKDSKWFEGRNCYFSAENRPLVAKARQGKSFAAGGEDKPFIAQENGNFFEAPRSSGSTFSCL